MKVLRRNRYRGYLSPDFISCAWGDPGGLGADSGAFDYEQYYIAEWRNFDGYDKGLKTPYTTVYRSAMTSGRSSGRRTTHRVC